MKISEFIRDTDLDNTFLIGYYGGGNYGDELMLEILLNLFEKKDVKNLSVYFKNKDTFESFHRKTDCKIIDGRKVGEIIRAWFTSKKVVIGGGGLWGLDFNIPAFLLSVFIFVSKFILRKKVYLIGVGYYSSTGFWGRVGAWLSGTASDLVIVRDKESFANFSSFGLIGSKVFLDDDIAFQIRNMDLSAYQSLYRSFVEQLNLTDYATEIMFVSVRGFINKRVGVYNDMVIDLIKENPSIEYIISPLSTEYMGREFKARLSELRQMDNVHVLDFAFNPVNLYLLFRAYQESGSRIRAITPQFHGILTAYLAGIQFFPLSYDNKCTNFLENIDEKDIIHIRNLKKADIQQFIDNS